MVNHCLSFQKYFSLGTADFWENSLPLRLTKFNYYWELEVKVDNTQQKYAVNPSCYTIQITSCFLFFYVHAAALLSSLTEKIQIDN